jgi:hypothetical protein
MNEALRAAFTMLSGSKNSGPTGGNRDAAPEIRIGVESGERSEKWLKSSMTAH